MAEGGSGRSAGDRARPLGFVLSTLVGRDTIDDVGEAGLRAESGERVKLVDTGNAAHHVFEARFIRLIIGNVSDFGLAVGSSFDGFGKIGDGDFLSVADVD